MNLQAQYDKWEEHNSLSPSSPEAFYAEQAYWYAMGVVREELESRSLYGADLFKIPLDGLEEEDV